MGIREVHCVQRGDASVDLLDIAVSKEMTLYQGKRYSISQLQCMRQTVGGCQYVWLLSTFDSERLGCRMSDSQLDDLVHHYQVKMWYSATQSRPTLRT